MQTAYRYLCVVSSSVLILVIDVCIVCAHRLVTGINSRPTVCIVCLGSVHFVQQAAKCQGIDIVSVHIFTFENWFCFCSAHTSAL